MASKKGSKRAGKRVASDTKVRQGTKKLGNQKPQQPRLVSS